MALRIKRVIDVFGALMGLLVTSPVLMAVALGIVVSMGHPVFFRQERVGKDGRVFQLVKFRTMVTDAISQGTGLSVAAGDPRITWMGRFLRKTSLDELPQLFNVLKGDLSFVGPRPVIPEHLKYYGQFERRRLEMKPGMTGLATIRGRASIPWSERIRYDVEYVEKFSLWLDIRILVLTVIVVMTGKGIYYDHNKNGPAFDLPYNKKRSDDS